MRINVYSQELTDEVQREEKQSNTGIVYTAVRFMLHSSPMLHHPPKDDDRSAVTFWLPNRRNDENRRARKWARGYFVTPAWAITSLPTINQAVSYRSFAGDLYDATVIAVRESGRVDLSVILPGVKEPYELHAIRWYDDPTEPSPGARPRTQEAA